MSGWKFWKKAKQPSTPQPFFETLLQRSAPPKSSTQSRLKSYTASAWNGIAVAKVAETVARYFQPRVYKGRPGTDREDLEKHPFYDLLDNPSPGFTWFDLIFSTQACVSLTGDGFLIVLRNQLGQAVELLPVSPMQVSTTPTREQPYFTVTINEQFYVRPENMIWIRKPNPSDVFGRGIGPSEQIDRSTDAVRFIDDHIAAYFLNGALPEFICSLENASEPELAAIREGFRQNFGGPTKAGKVHYTGLPLSIERLDTTFRDQDLLNIRKDYRDVTCAAHGCPPEILSIIENSNRASIEAAEYLFLKGTITTWIKLWEQAMQRKLLKPGFFLCVPSFVPEDAAALDRAIAIAPDCFTINEIRAAHGLPPVDDGDELRVNAPNMASPESQPDPAVNDPGMPTPDDVELDIEEAV